MFCGIPMAVAFLTAYAVCSVDLGVGYASQGEEGRGKVHCGVCIGIVKRCLYASNE